MGFVGERTGGVVVVGVKLDLESRELLTWAMVKVAQPGDRVIALHDLNPSSYENTSTLIALVKTFDSLLAVYEGFCNLKQVDLKLKVCRGSAVQKVLVQEAGRYAAAKVVVGMSTRNHKIRSSVLVAKYCARNLSKSFGVMAVDNGKVEFERKATVSCLDNLQDENRPKNFVQLVHQALSKNIEVVDNLGDDAVLVESLNQEFCNSLESLEKLNGDGAEDNSLVLVPIQANTALTSSNSITINDSHELKSSWPFLRRKHPHKPQVSKKSFVKSWSIFRRVVKRPSQYSHAVVHPDQKKNGSNHDEDAAIVPIISFKSLPRELEGLHEKYSSICRLFSYEELLTATSNFMPSNLIGKGGSSHVYKGCLPDGKELAVKILKPDEDVTEFVSEVEIITTLHHKNIISIIGFCFEYNNLILVYDFLSRGNLEENLYGNKTDGNTFGWQERQKVAVGIAEALDHLHNGIAEPVIHRDVKSSNILLSDDFEPQLADFGLAKQASTSSFITTCTDVAGTFGYLAPEYFMHGKVSDKIDVYAFGVVLLELLSGRKPINSDYPKGEESLLMWAKPILKDGKLSQLLDPNLGNNYNHEETERMVLAATLCTRCTPKSRPQISVILKLLQGDKEATECARQQVSVSEKLESNDGETFSTNIQSHLNLALLDLEGDSLSIYSAEQNVTLEEYLKGRCSHSTSFDCP